MDYTAGAGSAYSAHCCSPFFFLVPVRRWQRSAAAATAMNNNLMKIIRTNKYARWSENRTSKTVTQRWTTHTAHITKNAVLLK